MVVQNEIQGVLKSQPGSARKKAIPVKQMVVPATMVTNRNPEEFVSKTSLPPMPPSSAQVSNMTVLLKFK